MVAPGGWSDAGGPDNGSGEGRGAPFVHSVVGAVGGAGGCGDATGASVGIESVGVADTGCGVVDKDVSALVSPSAVLMRCHRLGRIAWGSVMPRLGRHQFADVLGERGKHQFQGLGIAVLEGGVDAGRLIAARRR